MSITLATQLELHPGAQIFEFDSSAHGKTYRVELSDGRHFQINEKLYHLLECLRLPTSLAGLAAAFQQRTGQTVSTDQLEQLSAQLEEQGVIHQTGQALKERPPMDPHEGSLLALHYRRDFLSTQAIAPLARILQVFFTRPVAILMVALIATVHVFAYAQTGFPPNLQMENINWPVFYVIMLASFLLHELGHLAACHRWRCPHGALGVGLYFFNPVFYVDVTAAWRLSRWQRVVVDIGGVYIQLAFVSLLWFGYAIWQDNTYLLAVLLTDLMLLGNFQPFMKLDGYWLLSDLTGVPNLHARTGELTRHAWAWLRRCIGLKALAPSTATPFTQWSPLVRVVILSYAALSVAIWPLVILALIPMLWDVITRYPVLWTTALSALGEALQRGDLLAGLGQLQVLFLPTLVLINLVFLLKRTVARLRKARK
jgi:putative peptide zinc metalloprotease protein